MALTWEFYVAMILLVIALLIIAVFVYLLYNPEGNLFDKIKSCLKSKGKGGVVSSQPLPQQPMVR